MWKLKVSFMIIYFFFVKGDKKLATIVCKYHLAPPHFLLFNLNESSY